MLGRSILQTMALLLLSVPSGRPKQGPTPPSGHPFNLTLRQGLIFDAYLTQARLLGWNETQAFLVADQVLGIQHNPQDPVAPILARLPQ